MSDRARAHGRPHVGQHATAEARTRTLPRLNRAMEDTCSATPIPDPSRSPDTCESRRVAFRKNLSYYARGPQKYPKNPARIISASNHKCPVK
eukprot:1585742-Prymnesium_polylepis.2